MTDPDQTAARAAAQEAFTAAGGAPLTALEAALTAFEGRLIARGVLLSGDAALDAENAAQRLADASDHNLFTGDPDAWQTLLNERHKVWTAFHAALAASAGATEHTRHELVRDRDLCLAYIASGARHRE